MRSHGKVAALLIALSSPAFALVSWPISKMTPIEVLKTRALIARGTISENLLNNISLYQASVTIGTPPQAFSIQIDTGSSDIFIMDANCDQCVSARVQAKNNGGCYGGVFNSAQSSSYKLLDQGSFEVLYGDDTGAFGDFISDNLVIGNVVIRDQIMGLAYQATTGVGLLGIGYDTNEAAVKVGNLTKPYSTIIDSMLSQGAINTKSYSLYLDDLTAGSGSIIFGGADTNKFIGSLKTVPILASSGRVISEMLVSVTSISMTDQSNHVTQITSTSSSVPYLLDSGSTILSVPDSIFDAFQTIFSASETSSGDLFVSCSLRDSLSRAFVTFTFGQGGPVINVPVDELILPVFASNSKCQVAVSRASGTNILGDTFLRSAYVVYDLTHNQIGLAQANFESSNTAMVEFKASDSGIPTLTGLATGTTLEPGSKNTAVGIPKPLEMGGIALLAFSGLFAVIGGAWFLS